LFKSKKLPRICLNLKNCQEFYRINIEDLNKKLKKRNVYDFYAIYDIEKKNKKT